MAGIESQQSNSNMDATICPNTEAQMTDSGRRRGGWASFPFIMATVAGLTLAVGGATANLLVYLTEEFNFKSIDAAQLWNIVAGCINLFPVAGAIIADSFLGCFLVISVSSFISSLGMVLLVLTAALNSLRPPPCENASSFCQAPSKLQYAVLYAGIALVSIGAGGTRFTIATMGANQFDEPKKQGLFFNWYFFTLYSTAVVGSTVIVYVQDDVSWALGFGLSLAANLTGLAMFFLGSPFYRETKPEGSPFLDLARVIVASFRKRRLLLSSRSEDYYEEHDGVAKMAVAPPTKSFRWFNRAAMKTEEMQLDGSMTGRSWRLCSVQQVEDLKTLIRIIPLWSTGIFLSTTIAVLSSLAVLQALTMDRHLGPHFKIPAASFLVSILFSVSVSILAIDQLLIPSWRKLTGQSPTPLQRVGLGHLLNVLGMLVSALVESRRLQIAQAHHAGSTVPMPALWLLLQLAVVGIGEALHFPGQVTLYYQEFPVSLRSTATAVIAVLVAAGFYLSTAVIGLIRRVTDWLPEDLNSGRLDNVYWTLVVVGALNFGYYLVCARLYKPSDVK